MTAGKSFAVLACKAPRKNHLARKNLFPAHAGMNRDGAENPGCWSAVPRACGDEPRARIYVVL